MNEIRELEGFCTVNDSLEAKFRVSAANVCQQEPIEVSSYSQLLKGISIISFYNHDLHLLFRGQSKEYLDGKQRPMIRPTILRNERNRNRLTEKVFEKRYATLKEYMKRLVCKVESTTKAGNGESDSTRHMMGTARLRKFEPLQWSILQHYGVSDTPLLDATQSLQVACSFALNGENRDHGYVYVIGVPYLSESISYSVREGIICTRLLSACPPEARRPYLQEGYLVGSFPEIKEKPENLCEHDFRNRLIARFLIKNEKSFWDCGFGKISEDNLLPKNDPFIEITRRIKTETNCDNQALCLNNESEGR